MLTLNFEQYAKYLKTRESFDPRTAKKFAEIMQEFHKSGKTALEYTEELRKKNFDWASAFVHNYGCYNHLFGELRPIRLEARERHRERKGQLSNLSN